MIVRTFLNTSSPKKMTVSAITEAPNFGVSRKAGFENPFWAQGSEKNAGYMNGKGNTVFSRTVSGASDSQKFATVYASDTSGFDFSSNSGAYNSGFNFASNYKTLVLDFENEYGDYDDITNVERVGNFIKGARDNGAKVGEFLQGMRIWNDKLVWSSGARTQLTNPVISGIGTKPVPSLNTTLGQLYNLHTKIGYGTIVVQGRQEHDPRAAIYNYIYEFLVFQKMKANGLLNHVDTSMGYLWGASDTFGSGIPNFWHNIPLDPPYNGDIRILNRSEENLKIMKGYALWALLLSNGFWYWNGQGTVSDTKNDVTDILQSGFPSGEMEYTGTSSLVLPSPRRIYPFMDGLSMNVCFEALYEFSQVESIVLNGTRSQPDFEFKRGDGGSFQPVSIASNGTGIVDAYEDELPIVFKWVSGSQVLYVLQDPSCNEGKITKVRVAHGGKTYFLAVNSDEPKIFKF